MQITINHFFSILIYIYLPLFSALICLVATCKKALSHSLSLLSLGNISISMYETIFFSIILFCMLEMFFTYAHVRHMRYKIIIIVDIAAVI